MTHRPLALGILIALTVLPAAAAQNDDTKTSDRVGFSTFREESGRLSVFVDGYPASVTAGEAYVPVPIAVALTQPGPPIDFLPESFTLIDAQGNSVPAAGYQEVSMKYERLIADHSLVRERPIALPLSIIDLVRVPARFYPAQNDGTRIPQVELAMSTWFSDLLYFPAPPAGVQGVMTLHIEIPGAAPVDVRFAANEKALAESDRDR